MFGPRLDVGSRGGGKLRQANCSRQHTKSGLECLSACNVVAAFHLLEKEKFVAC